MATNKHFIDWVIPVDTEPEIDWECPCLEGVACLDEVRAWYTCDRLSRKVAPLNRTMNCSEELTTMSKCISVNMKDNKSNKE